MELGVIGLGKMGGYMTERWQLAGHQIVAFDLDAGAV
jgi:6-phosphogluconate dehydrogenase (decarboxylating)